MFLYQKEMSVRNTICVVILHYNDYGMTAHYIENLKRLNWGSLSRYFVIVDNCSPDHSGRRLYDTYKDSLDIAVLLNSQNMGFAKGNNVGIIYAAGLYDPDLILVSNNDIYIKDPDLPLKLWEIYQSRHAAVIGPDIYSLRRKLHQSPAREKYLDAEDLKVKIAHIERLLKKLQVVKLTHTYELIRVLKHLTGKKSESEGYYPDREQENVVLAGAFFALSREYMEQYPDGLYDGTFLYMEEDILSYRCSVKGLKMLYTPDLKVFHYDGYATMKSQKKRCDKYIFELEETRKSCEVMLKLLSQGERRR